MKDLMLNKTKYLITDPEIQQYLPWQSYVVNYAPRSSILDVKGFVKPSENLIKMKTFPKSDFANLY